MINWDRIPLGRQKDSEIAERFGVSVSRVKRARYARGISSWRDSVDWDQQPLGKVPDAVIARQLGIRPARVGDQRNKRGISRFRAVKDKSRITVVSDRLLGVVYDCVGRIEIRPTRVIYRETEEFYGPIARRSVERALSTLILQGRIERRDEGYLRTRPRQVAGTSASR